MNDLVNQFSIKSKLLVLVLVSLGLALFFGLFHTWSTFQDKQEMSKISILVDLSTDMSNLMHESQRERGMTAGFIGSKGRLFTDKLPEQRKRFDKSLQHLQLRIGMLDETVSYGEQKRKLETIQAHLKSLNATRQKVSTNAISKQEVIAYYSKLNQLMLSYMEYITHVSNNAEVTEKVIAFTSFLESKERAGIERAVLSSVFMNDKFAEGEYRKFVSLVSEQKSYIHMFKATATDESLAFYKQAMTGNVVKQVDDYRAIAHQNSTKGTFAKDSAEWFKVSTLRINSLKKVEDYLTKSLLNRVHEIRDEKSMSYVLSISLLSLGVIFVMLLSSVIVRSVNKSVKTMQETMEEIAQTGNLSLRVPVSGKDEFAQIATCYNKFTDCFKDMIDNTNVVLEKIANGDFSGRMAMQVNGDLDKLQQGVNGSAESVEFMMSQLEVVMDGLSAGNFSVRMNNEVPEAFRNKVDGALEILSSAVSEVNTVMTAMQKGQYENRVNSEVPGELNIMKESINTALDQLEAGMKEINDVMVSQSRGELNKRITGQYEGRLDELTKAINTCVIQMSSAIKEVKVTASTVRNAAGEVAQGSESLSERVQSQAASLEETAASIEEMTSTINQSTDLAEQASTLSKNAIQASVEGSEVMSQTVVAMERINEVSVSINDIISLIDTIAFQTNLLALNAAVEAARAGEHGRGFAVVAAEVRNLAGRSAEAAKEIKELIEKTNQEVSNGTNLVKSSGDALADINHKIEKVSIMVTDIAKGSREQAAGIDQINIAMASIDQTTQENAALVEETASSSENMAEDAEVLEGVVNKFTL